MGCQCCDILHVKSSAITYTAATESAVSTLTITLPSVTFTNGQVYQLILAQSLPAITAGDNPKVQLMINGASTYIPVYLQMGNYVRANSLANRTRLTMVYGSDPVHSTVVSPCLKY